MFGGNIYRKIKHLQVLWDRPLNLPVVLNGLRYSVLQAMLRSMCSLTRMASSPPRCWRNNSFLKEQNTNSKRNQKESTCFFSFIFVLQKNKSQYISMNSCVVLTFAIRFFLKSPRSKGKSPFQSNALLVFAARCRRLSGSGTSGISSASNGIHHDVPTWNFRTSLIGRS